MGYYANGAGTITLNTNKDSVVNEIAEVLDVAEVLKGTADGTFDISVYDDDKYYDYDVKEMLSAITPYTIDGDIRYAGEDETFWRFYFDKAKKKWECEPGYIVWVNAPDEIPDSLIREVGWEYEKRNRMNDLLSAISENYPHIPEDKRKALVDTALEVFVRKNGNNVDYYDSYWNDIDSAIKEALNSEDV